MAESMIDVQVRLEQGLSARQRHQLSKLLRAVRDVAAAQAKADEAIAARDSCILNSVDDYGLDVRRIVSPATGLTHTRINQILAKEG